MIFIRFKPLCVAALLLGCPLASLAQQVPPPTDTIRKYENPAGYRTGPKKPFFQSKGFRATIVPAVLIGYGISTINGHGFYSSYDAKRNLNRAFGVGQQTRVDDFCSVR